MRNPKRANILLLTVVSGLALILVSANVRAAGSDIIIQALLSGVNMNGLNPSGLAEHRLRADGSSRLKVQAQDVNLPAGTILNVFVNGTSVGSLSINSFRQGELQLESNNGQSVPNIAAGTTVVVKSQVGATIVSGIFGDTGPTPSPTATPTPGVTPSPTPSPSPDDANTTVQFGAPGYTVAENARSLAITVTRTGDLTHDSKVDYRSSDGSAHDKTDYTTAAGRLFFAPGESVKTINLLITDDGFAEGDETFFLTLFDASHRTAVGNPGTTTITITDNDTTSTDGNPVDDPTLFVVQHYMDFLNREPEPGGLKAWEDVLRNCGAGDDRCDRIQVSSSFFRSPEFQDRGYFLYRFYSTSMGRIPLYAEFEKDMSRTSGSYTEAEQEANKALFADDFVTRQDFKDIYDQYTRSDDYVNALLNTAGVTVSNKDDLIAGLQSGQLTRAQVLRSISESQEVKSKYQNESFVVMQYFGYLRRDPDIHYLDWLKVLNETGEYRTMINGFINSIEYRHRFGER